MLYPDRIYHAQSILEPVLNRTPMIGAKGFAGHCRLYFKAECLQKTGAFKLRGAYYKISCLSQEEKGRGVIACSAGNHAQGVAYAARDMGIPATICIPEVNHERNNLKAPIGSVVVHVLAETRDRTHIDTLYAHLKSRGYMVMER